MRGKVYNEDRARQLRDFSGLRFGAITPTDVDGLLDFNNKLFVLIEAKVTGASLPKGQRLALERVCDAIQDEDKTAAILVITHNTQVDQKIDFANCQVIEYRYKKTWKAPHSFINCRDAIEKLLIVAGVPF